ncbi:hypothetical protein QTP70_015961 [Hemibagrus guttatus]|uniref:Uncharacterized protein n=1 Tax=Hemibagrus guttatus TaxID=175788 RepID=A0AAE0PTZ6_9TELE|nr:hypothetical protein QTP70_015961 [Hemibagrus guttatus]
MYEKSVENMEKNQKELTEILITMRNCEVKEIDFNTTIEMLVKGMDAMGRVKEQWEKMICSTVKPFKASNIASLVNMISGTYTEVSSKHPHGSCQLSGKTDGHGQGKARVSVRGGAVTYLL